MNYLTLCPVPLPTVPTDWLVLQPEHRRPVAHTVDVVADRPSDMEWLSPLAVVVAWAAKAIAEFPSPVVVLISATVRWIRRRFALYDRRGFLVSVCPKPGVQSVLRLAFALSEDR